MAIVLLGVVVMIASSVVFATYYPNLILMMIGLFVGVVIIIIGGKYRHYKKQAE